MNYRDEQRFLSIRMKGKTGRGETTQDELDFLAECRKDYPDTCRKLEEEVSHRAIEFMNPYYVRPEGEQ